MRYDDEEEPRPLGVVPVEGRGHLPFALVRGESLVACASWALGEAEVDLVDFNVGWDLVRDSGRVLVVHDPLCPLTPPAFILEAIGLAVDDVVVGVLPGGVVASPVVLPAAVVAGIERPPDLTDLAAFVERLRGDRVPVRPLPAPPAARRITSESDLVEGAGLG